MTQVCLTMEELRQRIDSFPEPFRAEGMERWGAACRDLAMYPGVRTAEIQIRFDLQVEIGWLETSMACQSMGAR